MNIICFHNPDEQFGFLSNWYLSDFCIDDITYSSMEQYMMHRKAMLFGDVNMASAIMNTVDVAVIKEFGRKVSGFNESIWCGVRQIVIYRGLMEKFRQNDDLKAKLFETGNSILVECAVKDLVWGNGLAMTDEKRLNIDCWRGSNLLGFSLMMVRDELLLDLDKSCQ